MAGRAPYSVLLCDRMLAKLIEPPPWFLGFSADEDKAAYEDCFRIQERTKKLLRQAHVFDVSNVAEYFWAVSDKERWCWNQDFPNLAPPFECYWMEYRRPSGVQMNNWFDKRTGLFPDRAGVLSFVLETTPELAAKNPWMKAPEEVLEQVRWTLHCETYAQIDERVCGPLTNTIFWLDEHGRILCLPHEGLVVPPSVSYERRAEVAERAADVAHPLIYPSALATCFIHCRNVTTQEHEAPGAMQKAYEKRNKQPLVRYHTLVIDPMKEVLKREGGSEESGLKKALHICRGHFADYTEGKGLFGKYHGRFWMPAHVRGKLKHGVVAKDYSVRAGKLTVDEG